MLNNKEGLWTSEEEWNLKAKDEFIYIENTSNTTVLGTTSDGKVILEDVEENKAEQLWKKGEPNSEGYFTLENSKVPKVLTAISSSSLEIKGIYGVKYLVFGSSRSVKTREADQNHYLLYFTFFLVSFSRLLSPRFE